MNYICVATILLSVVFLCASYRDGVRLINGLDAFFRFDHHIFFVDSATDLSSWFPSGRNTTLVNFTPQTIYTFDDRADSDVPIEITSKNTFLVVVADRIKIRNDSRLLAQIEVIRQLEMNVKIGVFFALNITSLDIVEQWFRWSWTAGIVKIFCAFHLYAHNNGEPSFNVFKYNPFGTFELINVTNISLQQYFLNKIPNYCKHPLRFQRLREFDVGIVDIESHDTFVQVFNASMSILYVNSQSEDRGVDTVNQDLSFNEVVVQHSLTTLYPHRQSPIALVFPHSQPYSDFVAYLQNGTWTLLFVCASIVVVASSLLLVVSRYLQQKNVLLFQCVADVINLLMNDNATIRYQNLHRSEIFVIVPLTFTGLIVMNGIVAVFKSFLTSPIYHPQIDTLKDLYASTTPILARQFFWKDELIRTFENITKYGGWSDKVHGIGVQRLANEMATFNNSIAFIVYDHEAQVYLESQKRLALEAYHVSSERPLAGQLISYEINSKFPFTEHINDIVHRLNGAGLVDKWSRDHDKTLMSYILEMNLNLTRNNSNNQSDDSNFSVPAVVWCAWIVSFMVFICEIIWDKVRTVKPLMPPY